ncbi:MAG: DMT family transporter [Rhodobacteraceae bacterium]|nr:DMT family transporter [Paracoccaceae bacterium]
MTAPTAPAPAFASDRILPGVALMIAFCVVAPLIDVSAKLAAATVPVGQITAARFLVQAVLMAPIVHALGHSFRLAPRALGLACLRALLLILSTYTFVSAVAVMPVADALAIAFVEPFLLLLLGWAIWGERVGPRRILACAVGFAGALLVIRPSLALFGPVALYPLGTALCFALYMLVTRSLSRAVHPVPMQFHTAAIGLALCLPVLALAEGSGLAPLDPVWPRGTDWAFLAGVGLAATVSHMAISYALTYAPSATLAPLHYLEIVSAVFFGYLIFGDFPAPLTWAGIGLIAASGLYIIHRERRLARQVAPPAH